MTSTRKALFFPERYRIRTIAAIAFLVLAAPTLFAEEGEMWSGRLQHAATVFDPGDGERMWVLGGRVSSTGSGLNDVWSSTDGRNWTLVTDDAGWSPRFGHAVAVFDNRLWVLGGAYGTTTNGTPLNDIWSSTNGIDWTEETLGADPDQRWTARSRHATAVFNDRLWVLGGRGTSPSLKNDVWSSEDGVNWDEETPGADWDPRSEHATEVFGGKLWVMGGHFGGIPAVGNDIWSSEDGVNWSQPPAGNRWGNRRGHASAVFDPDGAGDRLWIVGGSGSSPVNSRDDVWSSVDGLSWIKEPAAHHWTNRRFHASLVFNSQLWVLGGERHRQGISNNLGNDIWSSEDGMVWFGPALITNKPPVAIAGGSLFTFAISTTGWPLPFIDADGLPDWLDLNGNTLTGTPQDNDIGQTGPITITASNEYGADTLVFTLNVQGVPPEILGDPVKTVIAGEFYSYTVETQGFPTPSLSVENLPDWLDFDQATGELFGTAPAHGQVTDEIVITASNGIGEDWTQTFAITVGVPPVITSAPVTFVLAGEDYEYAVIVEGFPAPTFSPMDLPSWLSFSLSTGLLSGTAPADDPATIDMEIMVSNGFGNVAVQAFTITVGLAPQITSAPVEEVKMLTPYSYFVAVAGFPQPDLEVTGLPGWLQFNAETSEIFGTAPGNAHTTDEIIITATSEAGVDTQAFAISVTFAPSVGGGGAGGCVGGGSGAAFGWLALLALPLLWARRRTRPELCRQ